MALKISELKRYSYQQQSTINDVVDKVDNNTSICSKSDRSIPDMIKTSGTPLTIDSSEQSTTQSLIASLTLSLAEAKRSRYRPRNKRGPGGCDDPVDRSKGGEGGKGAERY